MAKLISLNNIWSDNTSLAYIAYYSGNSLYSIPRPNSFPNQGANNFKYYTESAANNASFLANFQSHTTAYGLKSLNKSAQSTTKLITRDILQQGALTTVNADIRYPISDCGYYFNGDDDSQNATLTGVEWNISTNNNINSYLLYGNSYLLSLVKNQNIPNNELIQLQENSKCAFMQIGQFYVSYNSNGNHTVYTDCVDCHMLSKAVNYVSDETNPIYYYLVIVPYYNRCGLSNGCAMGYYGGANIVNYLKSYYKTQNNYVLTNLTNDSTFFNNFINSTDIKVALQNYATSMSDNGLNIFYEVKLCSATDIKSPSYHYWYHLATTSEPYGFCPFNYYTCLVQLSKNISCGFGSSMKSKPWVSYVYEPTWYNMSYQAAFNGYTFSLIDLIKDKINLEAGYNICDEAYFLCDLIDKNVLNTCAHYDNVKLYFGGTNGVIANAPSAWSYISDAKGLSCFYKTIILPIAVKYGVLVTPPSALNCWRYGRQVTNTTPNYMPIYKGVTYLTTLQPNQIYSYALS